MHAERDPLRSAIRRLREDIDDEYGDLTPAVIAEAVETGVTRAKLASQSDEDRVSVLSFHGPLGMRVRARGGIVAAIAAVLIAAVTIAWLAMPSTPRPTIGPVPAHS